MHQISVVLSNREVEGFSSQKKEDAGKLIALAGACFDANYKAKRWRAEIVISGTPKARSASRMIL